MPGKVDFFAYKSQMQNLAKVLGYTTSTSVKKKMLGPATDAEPNYSGATERLFIFSSTSPSIPSGSPTMVWFNPETRTFYKSVDGAAWAEVIEFIFLFLEYVAGGGSVVVNDSGFTNGVAEVPVILQGTPSDPNEAANKAYVDMAIASVASGGSSVLYGPPVQSITDLRAIDTSGLPDKQLRLVEDAHKIYSYDLQSTQPDDNEYTLAPLSGIGRWVATNPNIIDGGAV